MSTRNSKTAKQTTLIDKVVMCASKNTSIDSSDLKRYFKANGWNSESFDNSIMRAARRACDSGYLSRVSPGVYKITTKGRKTISKS